MEGKRPRRRRIKKSSNNTAPLKAIRNSYADMGVDAFYRNNGDTYQNPHYDYIKQLLVQNESRIGYKSILDFCCGSGEVSQVLHEMGYKLSTGCDPYTQKAYSLRMEKPCLGHSFEDIVQGKLSTKQYSSVISSFAMHLCPAKQLYPLVQELFKCTKQLVIITPHKRPALDELDGVSLVFEDFVLTERGKKVRLMSYKSDLG